MRGVLTDISRPHTREILSPAYSTCLASFRISVATPGPVDVGARQAAPSVGISLKGLHNRT